MLKFLQVCHLPSTSLAQTCTSAFRDLSTSTSARFARFQERYRFNPNRRPQSSPKVYDTQKVANELVHPDAIPVRPPRNLWIATVFTAGIGAFAYTTAAVWEYEKVKHARRDAYNFINEFSFQEVLGNAEKSYNTMQLSPGNKVAFAIIGINTLVCLLWRIPRLQPAMYRYFTNSFASKSLCAPMLLSVFSHNNWIHLALNMYVLYSFCPVSADRFLGVEQFLALYVTSGVFSSLTSLAHKAIVKSNVRALGASGAICALLAYTCMKIPDARLSIIFLPFIQFSAEQAVYGLVAFDLLGLIFRFRLFDHAAHLGGTLFGILYAMYGEHWVKKHFNPKVYKICQDVEKKNK